MKVVFVNPIGELGGAERSLLDLLWSLKSQVPELSLRMLALSNGPLLAECRALDVETDVLELPRQLGQLGESNLGALAPLVSGASSSWQIPAFVRRLHSYLVDVGAQVVHTNGLKAHLLGALARPAGVPVYWHIRDFVTTRPLTRRVVPLLQQRIRAAIGISRSVTEDARSVLHRVPVHTVLNGIRTDLFRRSSEPVDLDALAGLPPTQRSVVRVGLVATYAFWKGHELFLSAVQQLRERRARFYVIGGPIYGPPRSQISEAELRRRISVSQLGDRCGLIPFKPDMTRAYSALDVLVQASTRPEPFGRTVAEGMASGCAVVAPRCGGIVEQLRHDVDGLLFEPGSADELRTALERLLADETLRRRLSASAVSRAHQTLDASRLGPEVARIYFGATSPRGGVNA